MASWLHVRRLDETLGVVRACGARSVVDLGCGSGDFILRLVGLAEISQIVGIDRDGEALKRLATVLRDMPEAERERVRLIDDCLIARAADFAGFDCAVLVETIEHIDPDRLGELTRAVFGKMRPASVVLTTPNADFNHLLGVPAHRFRHPDHRFEWGRAAFRQWCAGVAGRHDYVVDCCDLAGGHPVHGGASQLALFRDTAPGASAR